MAVGGPLTTTNRVVALDVRGFGKSSKFAEPTRFGQQMVDDVTRVMDHLKVDRAHLVGHSMGALIAANVASRYPKRVASATLIAGPFYRDKATFTKEVGPWVADLESGKGLTNFLQWLFPAMPPQMAAGASAGSLKTNDLPSLIAVMRSLPDLAIAGVRADVPLLVAVGTADPLHPLSAPFVKSSARARLLELEKADHVNVLVQPTLSSGMRELQTVSASSQSSGR
jgi:pimeloyl-ACP methyl ester carboxylesterase